MLIAGTKPKSDMENCKLLGLPTTNKAKGAAHDIKSRQSMNETPKTRTSKFNDSTIKESNSLHNNMTQLEKRQYKLQFPNQEFQPAYARPTIATTTRENCIAEANAAKALAKTRNSTEYKSPIKETHTPAATERLTAGVSSKYSEKKYKLRENLMTIEVPPREEVDIQTNEMEILNHDMVMGDVKLVLPSPAVILAVEHARKEKRKQAEAPPRRKYDAHDERKTAHLSDLKEFLESATIKKRTPQRASPTTKLQMKNKKVVYDEIGTKGKETFTKTQSIMSIKTRIKQKENELLSLFENVEKF